MATWFCRELSAMADVTGIQVSREDSGVTEQTPIPLSGSSQQSAAFNAATRYIMMTASGIFSYKIGANPTATTSHMRIPADNIIFIGVKAGEKIAVITNT